MGACTRARTPSSSLGCEPSHVSSADGAVLVFLLISWWRPLAGSFIPLQGKRPRRLFSRPYLRGPRYENRPDQLALDVLRGRACRADTLAGVVGQGSTLQTWMIMSPDTS